MKQQELLENFKSFHYEVDDYDLKIDSKYKGYTYTLNYRVWDGFIEAEVYNPKTDTLIELNTETINELFDYIIEIYNEREKAMQDIIDTQDWLDTYGR